MNQLSDAIRAEARLLSERQGPAPPADPIAVAAEAIDRILATAHEAGQQEAVRVLHAVGALLSATPRQ